MPGHSARADGWPVVELRQLRAFVSVATELHFGHAADQLHLNPATRSDLIRSLETWDTHGQRAGPARTINNHDNDRKNH